MCRPRNLLFLLPLLFCGCQQEMANQPRYDALEPLPEGVESLGPVQGTVARGNLQLDDAYFTGKQNSELVTEMPGRAMDGTNMQELLAHGQQRFVVFCAQCHGQVGGGTGGSEEMLTLVGMVVKRGFPVPPTYHQPRLRDAPIGHFFDVITNGLGRMPAHGYMIPPQDRWAIAAYIRALQFSQHASQDRLNATDLGKLSSHPKTK
jgi:mono/diheme cytochrome c family protein